MYGLYYYEANWRPCIDQVEVYLLLNCIVLWSIPVLYIYIKKKKKKKKKKMKIMSILNTCKNGINNKSLYVIINHVNHHGIN